ncbi:S-layer homology domain-containing protein, partial [Lysinibacillus sp. NPDC093210]|uniref:S-layer homology domain-containing protein n=1 Tax=Lysinibacillus sp. NPDC093210 TaxID=3364133 RepID=UPI0038304BF2
EGSLLTFMATATDSDSALLTYSLVGAPTGASINATTGVFTWTPTKAQGPGSYTFIVRVSDGLLTDSESITVTVNEVNSAPVLQAIGNKAVNENSQLKFTASATDADGNTLTYSLVNAPTGASINATTGVFTWTPTKAQGPGSYTFIVRVSDGLLTDEESITVTVSKVNSPPVLQAIGNKTVNEESQLTFKASATDADGDTLTYSLVGAPKGASINATTGVFTWTPTEAQGPGSYTFIVRVSDGRLTDEESIMVTVNEINNVPIYNNTDATSTTPIKLEPIKYKIIFNTNGGSAIGIQSLEKNKNIIKPENPKREGYLFEGWYKDPEFKVKWDFEKDVITVSTTLYAKWIENSKEIVESKEEEKPTTYNYFSDVSTHWSKEMIEEIAALGIINGYPDGTFRPNEPILRKHIAIMINRALDLKPIRENASFSDVLPTHPYYKEILLLQQAGIVDGTNGQFKPDEFLTRAQLAKIIVISFDFALGDESNFEDLSKNHWSYRYVAGLEKLGIVQGDNGKFNPQDSITRAQFVAILYRALNLAK